MQPQVLFDAGLVVRTPGAAVALIRSMTSEACLMARHQAGDWGDVSTADADSNLAALRSRRRIFSAYRLRLGDVVWVITEDDRSLTTLLLPSEYQDPKNKCPQPERLVPFKRL